MKIEIGDEMLAIELIDTSGKGLRDIKIGHVFANDGAVFCFCEAVIIAMAWPALCLFRMPPIQKFMHNRIDVFAAIVAMEIFDMEREKHKRLIKRRLNR